MPTIIVDDDVVAGAVLGGAVKKVLNGDTHIARARTDTGEKGIPPDRAQHARA